MKERKLQVLAVLAASLIIAAGASAFALAQSSTPATSDASTVATEAGTEGATEAENDGIDHEFEGEEVGENGDGVPDANEADEGNETESADENMSAPAGSITKDEAIAIAQAKADGAVLDVEVDKDGDTVVYEVELDSGTDVAVNAATGDVIRVEARDADNQGEQD